MVKKNTTIDDLALMVQKGFNAVDKRFDEMATKNDIKRLEIRLDRLENVILQSHQKRIEKLEAEVKELREMFAM